MITVDEIMTRDVLTVGVDTPVDEVAATLYRNRISGVPVVDAGGQVVGLVSEFDVIGRRGKVARDIMTADVISVGPGTPAEDVAAILTNQRVRRVPVVDGGQAVGIVSRSDLVRLFSMTRWSCEMCGYFERGFHRPDRCAACGSTQISLDREPPGM